MSKFREILSNLPEVSGPEKRLTFKQKLNWTIIILVSFFVLSIIPLWGLGPNNLAQFEQLSIILGASFGSIISLGIGPLVTASIVLQLLNGSGLLKFDTTSQEGRVFFQGVQKTLGFFFIIFEASVFVLLGGLSPTEGLALNQYRIIQFALIGQLVIGGVLIMLMDEVVSKWGFGSGLSLFIAAGVAEQIFVRAFSPLSQAGTWALGTGLDPIGQVWVLLKSVFSANVDGAVLAFAGITATLLVFVISVYGQAMKVEIPLSFGRIRGQGIRWPLNFIYTSNIPVILIAALIANIQLWARLIDKPWLGTFSGGLPTGGIVSWLYGPNIVQAIYFGIRSGSFEGTILLQALVYVLFFIFGSIIFSIFWVQTSGMDAKSQAKQIMASGLQIPGFRRDPRVIEQLLSRYISPLTVMGGAFVGFLAATADLLGALSAGTGILLMVMIIYRLYEEIAKEHMMDVHPAIKKVIGGA
ncbi:MAG: preprotein translocase subunit SecY [Nanoarchaeota archaeon]|mgnify:CR=1 FL=1